MKQNKIKDRYLHFPYNKLHVHPAIYFMTNEAQACQFNLEESTTNLTPD
jgi:hypothetical protein